MGEEEKVSDPRFSHDQSLILFNFEGLFLLSPLDITRELCEFMISGSQGTERYKVPVVGKNGKLKETIEVSVLWSNSTSRRNTIQLSTNLQRFVVESRSHIGADEWQ